MSICIQDNKQEKIKTNGKFYPNNISENGKDLIVLSEEEDETKSTDPNPNNEKENVDQETYDKQIKAIQDIEKELKDEENALLLFQQLKTSQCIKSKTQAINNNVNKTANINPNVTSGTTIPIPNKVQNMQNKNNNNSMPNQAKLPVMKVTKQVALNAIEQQFAAKRSALKKHLERAFEKIPLPSPGVNSGLVEIAFVPSSIVNDFSSLIGLEEVCKSIQEYETQSSKSETKKIFSPFSCARCQTDYTPVWKREKPGSTGVVCENCLVGTHKTNLHKDFEVGIRNALSQYSTAVKELEKEYDELVNNPDNLDKFIKEHEKKLALTAAQQATSSRNKNASYPNNNLIYSNGNGSAAGLIGSSISNANNQQNQAMAVAASLASNGNSGGSNLASNLNAEVLQSLNPVQQAQLIAHLQAQAQQQQQQQQLVASLAAAAAASAKSNSSNNSAALSSLAASLASQQQQAQQLQQQQLLATVIATIQQQQQQQQQQAAALHQNDQISQLQSVLSLLSNQNNQRNLGVNPAVQSSQAQQQNRQQQLLQQTLLQYSLLQQQAAAQQQQHVIVTQQQQQQQQSSSNLKASLANQQQHQQLALLQHIIQQQAQQQSSTGSNNNSSSLINSNTLNSQNTSTTPALSTATTPAVASSIAAAAASSSIAANNNANAVASLNLLQSLQSLGAAAIKK